MRTHVHAVRTVSRLSSTVANPTISRRRLQRNKEEKKQKKTEGNALNSTLWLGIQEVPLQVFMIAALRKSAPPTIPSQVSHEMRRSPRFQTPRSSPDPPGSKVNAD